MKKLIAMLSIFLFIPFVVYSEELPTIDYYDVPWEINPNEYIIEMQKRGVEISEANINTFIDCTVALEDYKKIYDYPYIYSGVNISFPRHAKSLLTYGGYEVDSIMPYFHYIIEDGKVNTDIDSAQLYLVSISLDVTRDVVADVNKELTRKLTELYGKPEIKKYKDASNLHYTVTMWRGQNSAMVCVYLLEDTDGGYSNRISVRYGLADAEATFRKIQEIRNNQTRQDAENDYTGL